MTAQHQFQLHKGCTGTLCPFITSAWTAVSVPVGFLNETEKQSHEVLCAEGSAKEMEFCYHPQTPPSLWLQWGTIWSDFEDRASLWTWPWSSEKGGRSSAEAWWEGREKPSVLFPSSSPSTGSKCKPGSLQRCLPFRNSEAHTQASIPISQALKRQDRKPDTNLWINSSTFPSPAKVTIRNPGSDKATVIWGLSRMV